jgi:hypothetical protein
VHVAASMVSMLAKKNKSIRFLAQQKRSCELAMGESFPSVACLAWILCEKLCLMFRIGRKSGHTNKSRTG